MDEKRQWISVKDQLPETRQMVLCIVWSMNKKPIQLICQYTNGGEIECYNYMEDEPMELPQGWYELEEQHNGDADEHYFKREVTHWMPLPSPPELSES